MNIILPDGTKLHNWEEILKYASEHPEYVEIFSKSIPEFSNVWAVYQARQQYDNGQIGANDLLDVIGSNHMSMNPEEENWLNNEIARENTQQQQNFEVSARDTSLLSSGSQLQQLGLSPSGVIQVGGASAGVQASTADLSRHSASQQHQQERINKFNQQMGLAKSLIGAASSMASSGIYGAALGAVKHAGSQIAGIAAHSARKAIVNNSWSGKGNGPLLSGKLLEEWNKLPGAY